MKTFMRAVFIVSVLAACNSKPSSPLETDVVVLTPGNKMQVYYDEMPDSPRAISRRTTKPAPAEKRLVPVIFTTKQKPANIETQIMRERNIVAPVEVKETDPAPAPDAFPTSARTNDEPINNTNIEKKDSVSYSATPAAVVKEKNIFSNATKGAVIGGVGGVIGGAIISKNKTKGAIIGGIIGATGGYIYGKTRDKKQAQDN